MDLEHQLVTRDINERNVFVILTIYIYIYIYNKWHKKRYLHFWTDDGIAFVRSDTKYGFMPADSYAYTRGLLVGYMLKPLISTAVGVVFTKPQFSAWNKLLTDDRIVDSDSLYAAINEDVQFTNRNWCDNFSSDMLAVLTTDQLRLYIEWYSKPDTDFYSPLPFPPRCGSCWLVMEYTLPRTERWDSHAYRRKDVEQV